MRQTTSSRPKGATSYKETALGTIPRLKILRLELEGTRRVLELVHKLISKDTHVEISPNLILKLHNRAFGWIFPAWAGKYRTIRVEFSGKEAVLPSKIPELIVNLCADLAERLKHLNSKDDNYMERVVELLAWFQHRFVSIHPFQDYNGRIARVLTTLIVLNLGLPPIEIKAETGTDRKSYLAAMYAADEGDYRKLESLIRTALNESLTKAI